MLLSKSINRLIADEWIAEYSYQTQAYLLEKILEKSVYSRLLELSNDEKKHRRWLIDYANNHNLKIDINPTYLLDNCNRPCRYIPFDQSLGQIECIKRGIESEINAKNMYHIYYSYIKKSHPALCQLYMKIADEEEEHKVELTELLNQLNQYE